MPIYDVDGTDYDPDAIGGLAPTGVNYVEVGACEGKRSSKGDPMLSLRLCAIGTTRVVAFDNIMLAGGGKNMGLAKLEQLGFTIEGGKMQIDTDRVKGRRLAVWIKHGDDTKGGKRAEVDIRAPAPFRCGYLNEEKALADGIVGETAQTPTDSTPF
jgi:hypothetical protein